jgi:hypothetical protein
MADAAPVRGRGGFGGRGRGGRGRGGRGGRGRGRGGPRGRGRGRGKEGEKERRSGSQSPSWAVWSGMERSSPWKRSTFSLCPSRSSRSLTSSLDLP